MIGIIVGAIVTFVATVLGAWLPFQIETASKVARIDYSFENPDDTIDNIEKVCYIDSPEGRLDNGFEPSNQVKEVDVFLRNRGDIDGTITLGVNAVGAKVSAFKDREFNPLLAWPVRVPNDNSWNHKITFFVVPEQNQQAMGLSLEAVGGQETQVFPQYTTKIDYQKEYIYLKCMR